jgi:8-oxo-dGTP diphosphatase
MIDQGWEQFHDRERLDALAHARREGVRAYPRVATDIIIEYEVKGEQRIIIIKRRHVPYGLALPGGMAELGLSLEQNAIKEAKEETGLDVELYDPYHPLCVRSDPNRDPRAPIISVAYVGKGYGILKAGDDAKEAHAITVGKLEQMVRNHEFVMDHGEIAADYLRYRAKREVPAGINLPAYQGDAR